MPPRKLESEGARDETIYFLGGASSIGYRNVTPEEVTIQFMAVTFPKLTTGFEFETDRRSEFLA